MIFRESTKEDFEYMTEHSINKKVDRKQLSCVDYAYTLEHESKPLMVGGFRMIVPSTAWCWVDLGKDAGKNITVVYRVIKEWIDEFIKSKNIKRLQAFVRTDYPQAEKLVQHLGFHKESIMKNFFCNEDAYMYVRIA